MADEKGHQQHYRYKALSRVYSIVKPGSGTSENTPKSVPDIDPSDSSAAITKILEEEDLNVDYSIPLGTPLERHSPNLVGSTVLHFAHYRSKSGLCTEEERYIECYSSNNFISQNSLGSTPLHLIIERIAESEESISDDLYEWKMNINDLLQQHLKYNVHSNPSNRWGVSHFHVACMMDHFELVNFFLDSGVSVNARVNMDSPMFPGYSPLHIATRFSSIGSVKILLTFGADIRNRDAYGLTSAYGSTPLELSVLRHRDLIQSHWIVTRNVERAREVVRILIQAHIDKSPNHTLYKLHLACTIGREKARGKFSKRVINVQLDKALGYTAVHYAAHFDEKTLKYLLDNGGDLLVLNSQGITPLDICIIKHGAGVFKLFSGSLKKLVRFQDNSLQIKAWNVLSILHNNVELENYLSTVDENIAEWRVSSDSAIWQGFTLLHVAVILAKEGRISLEHNDSKEIDLIESKWRNSNNDDPPWLKSVQILMTDGADFTVQDDNGMSPLHLAFHLGKISVIESMLTLGTFVANPVDGTGLSHFHIACLQGDLDSVKIYVSNGISVSDPIKCDYKFDTGVGNEKLTYRKGSTALHIALVQKRKDMVDLLLSHGSDILAQNEDNLTPMHLVFEYCKESFDQATQDLLDLILAKCYQQSGIFDPLSFYSSYSSIFACHDAIDNSYCIAEALARDHILSGEFRPPETMLENWQTTDATHFKRYKLHADVMECLNLMLVLISHNYERKRPLLTQLMTDWIETAPLKEFGLTKLHIAAGLSRSDYIERWRTLAVDVNAQISSSSSMWPGYTALHMALEYFRPDKQDDCTNTIRILLEQGADGSIQNSKNESALHIAFKKGLGEIVSMILSSKSFAINNTMDNFGLTHLHIACSMDVPEIVTKFLETGSDIHESTEFYADIEMDDDKNTIIVGGSTPLHIAVLYRIEEVVNILLSNGADANARDTRGLTPLHLACVGFFNEKIVERLFSVGHADPNVMNVMNETPFHVLMKYGQVDSHTVETLLKFPTSVNTGNFDCGVFSPIEFAVKLRDFEVLKITIRDGHDLDRKLGVFELNALQQIFWGDSLYYATFTQPKAHEFNRVEYLIIIDLLSDKGCDVDSQDKDGRTSLYLAVKRRNIEGVKALLMSGASINILAHYNHTALQKSYSIPSGHHMKTKTILMNHITTLKSLGFFICSDINYDYDSELAHFSDDNPDFLERNARQECETKKMKKVIISKGWTLYDVLRKRENEIASIVNNEVLKEILTPEYIFREYPVLGCILRLQYKRSVVRRKLFDTAIGPLQASVHAQLPKLCWDIIMKNISSEDLSKIIGSS